MAVQLSMLFSRSWTACEGSFRRDDSHLAAFHWSMLVYSQPLSQRHIMLALKSLMQHYHQTLQARLYNIRALYAETIPSSAFLFPSSGVTDHVASE